MIDVKLAHSIEILKRKTTIPEANETSEEISNAYDYAISLLETIQDSNLLPIKDNLDKRICDVEENAVNTDTYREFLKSGYMEIMALPVTDEELNSKTNLELNAMLEELDYLLDK